MSSPIAADGRFRPWPVRFMEPETAELYERAAREHGGGLASLHAATVAAWPNENAHTQNLAWALGAWHVHGRQSFRVSPLLVEALRETSLKLVPTEALRSPYPALWVESDEAILPDTPFNGFFLMEGTAGEALSADQRTFVSANGMDDASRLLLVSARGEGTLFTTHAFLCRPTLEESIEASLELNRRARELGGLPSAPTEADALAPQLWALVANFLLYLSSPDPDLQPVVPSGLEKSPRSAKAREIQKRIRNREGYPSEVGYRLTRVVHAAQRSEGGGEESQRTVAAHLVRGHWKHQPHGVGRAERKLIWIAPYRRGDDGGEEHIERTYAV